MLRSYYFAKKMWGQNHWVPDGIVLQITEGRWKSVWLNIQNTHFNIEILDETTTNSYVVTETPSHDNISSDDTTYYVHYEETEAPNHDSQDSQDSIGDDDTENWTEVNQEIDNNIWSTGQLLKKLALQLKIGFYFNLLYLTFWLESCLMNWLKILYQLLLII